MMRRARLAILLVSVLLLASACGEEGVFGATVITEGEHRIAAGERVRGDLLVLDGAVRVEAGAVVTGSMHVLGGTVVLAGAVDGDLSVLGGEVAMLADARVGGDLVTSGGTVDRSPDATIGGTSGGFEAEQVPLSPAWEDRTLATRLQSLALATLLPMALAYLLLRVRPRPVARIGAAITDHPLVSGSLGLLAGVIGLVLAVFMAFTIVLLPVAVGLLLLVGLVALLGWIALGHALASRLARWRGGSLPPAPLGALGVGLLAVLAHLLELVPVIGALVPIAAVVVGFGAVLLTRFGTRTFVPQSYDIESESTHAPVG